MTSLTNDPFIVDHFYPSLKVFSTPFYKKLIHLVAKKCDKIIIMAESEKVNDNQTIQGPFH